MYKKLLGLLCSVFLCYSVVSAQVNTVQKYPGKLLTSGNAAVVASSGSNLESQGLQKLDPLLRYFLRLSADKTPVAQAAIQELEKPGAVLNLERETSGQLMVWVFIKSTDVAASASEVQKQGGTVTTVAGDILVAKVPATWLETMAGSSAVQTIEACTKSKPLLDVSRAEIGADKVQSGTGLSSAYTGDDVVVGIVDSGIDEDHDDFKTSSGSSRILYLWDMSGTSNPPSGYTYGREYTKAQIDAGQCLETDDNGHGTHVAGTAAGNGLAKTGYIGIAPEADIIFVKGFRAGSEGFLDNDVINGCSYIFKKAQALGKPAVINLSLGGHYGPHDGTSLYEQALSNLTGQGKIIVAAAGNEGSDYIHLSYATSGSSFNQAPETSLNFPSGTATAYIDIWYPGSGSITVGVADYNNSKSFEASPGNSVTGSTNTAVVQIDARSTSNSNGAKRVTVILLGSDLSGETLTLYTYGSGTLDAWFAVGGSFGTTSSGFWRPGDNNKSVGIPATAQKVICIGSYATKNKWYDLYGSPQGVVATVGQISSFSSRGPTRDGRTKPDLTAPGQVIGAALSSDASYYVNQRLQGGEMVILQGTSMAAPHVTGTLALMMAYYPGLDYTTALDILKNTARKDSYTGTSPAANTWGAGKLDAYAAMQSLGTSDAEIPENPKPAQFALEQNYPNPFNPATTISYTIPSGSFVMLKVYDLLGREVATLVNDTRPAGRYDVTFDASNLSSGVYFYRLTAGDFAKSKKMLLVK